MNGQIQIDFSIHQAENNAVSLQILNDNKDHFSNQCKTIYDAMMRGERLTTSIALIKYGIGDLRRRVKDLIDHNNVPVKSIKIQGRFKEYYLELNNNG